MPSPGILIFKLPFKITTIILWAKFILPFFVISTALSVSHNLYKTNDQTLDISVTSSPLYDFFSLSVQSPTEIRYMLSTYTSHFYKTPYIIHNCRRNKGLPVNTGKVCLLLTCLSVTNRISLEWLSFSKKSQRMANSNCILTVLWYHDQSCKQPAVLASSPEF